MIVGSIYQQIREVTGRSDQASNFQALSRAIELLANKGLFDPLIGYLNFSNSETDMVTLPREVKSVIRVTVNTSPTFFRNRLFEFALNTDGSVDGEELGFTWSDRGYLPIQDERKLPGAMTYVCENPADIGKTITVIGKDIDGYDIKETIIAGLADAAVAGAKSFYEIVRILRDATTDICLLYCNGIDDTKLCSQYYPDEVDPFYRVIKLSQTVCNVRIMFRRDTFEICSLNDIIPLQSKMAVIHATKAVRYFADDEYDKGDAALARAVQFITEEQAARDEANALAQALEKPTTINRYSYNVREGIMVADVYDDASDIFGFVGRSRLFELIGDAVQLLANKAQWDSMTAVATLTAGTDGYVSLPRYIQTPLAVNINSNPAFARSRLFEYSLNTNGSETGEILGYSWAMDGRYPLSVDPSAPTVLTLTGSSPDASLGITFIGLDSTGKEISETILINATGALSFAKVTSVSKPATAGPVTVNDASANTLAYYYPDETAPNYRRIRISKPSASVKVLFKRRAGNFGSLFDFIPLQSRVAVVNAMRAMKAYSDGNNQVGDSYIGVAVTMLTDEMEMSITPQGDQTLTATDTTITVRDSIVVSDVYDVASEIHGPIGRPKLLDKITEAIEVLRNKAQWDALLGVVDIWMPDRSQQVNVRHGLGSGYFVLPRFVESIVSLNYRNEPQIARNRWFEFHLNGTGERNRASIGAWDDAGEVCIIQELLVDPDTHRVIPVQLVALPNSSIDNDKAVTIYGMERLGDGTEVEVYRNGVPGFQIPCHQGVLAPGSGAPQWVEITRIFREPTSDFVRLVTTTGSAEGALLGWWYPDEQEPKYRAIRTSTSKAKRIRVLYRKRTLKITSLFEPIPLRSRLAVENMLRAIKLMPTDPAAAQGYEQMAVNYLSEERINSIPSDTGSLQFDHSVMPGVCHNLT